MASLTYLLMNLNLLRKEVLYTDIITAIAISFKSCSHTVAVLMTGRSNFTIELMVSFLILLLSVSLSQYANAVLLPNTLTGTSLDTEKPLLPQFEKALDDIKQKESPEQFNARLENISAV